MKIISYNVNGIRAAIKKGFTEWLCAADPDVICLQEVKAMQEQVDLTAIKEAGYHIYWQSAEKKGYSGVAIFSKTEAKHVEYGCGMKKYDVEGRVIRADFEDISIMSVYMPSGTTGDIRQDFKYEWMDDFYNYINTLRKNIPNLIISGDYNICHKPIDIHNPVSNKKSSGFLPEERAWLDKFINNDMIDTFRHFNDEPHNYSWWSYRANSRANNKGWRIDYHIATKSLENRLKRAVILADAKHSDHCPILVELNN